MGEGAGGGAAGAARDAPRRDAESHRDAAQGTGGAREGAAPGPAWTATRRSCWSEGIERSGERDRARHEAYAAGEEGFRRKKLHEQKEARRDREREQRRFSRKMAADERERERLRHQAERELEALEAETDKLREQERSDEARWTAGRHEQVRGAGLHGYVPDKAAKRLGEGVPGRGRGRGHADHGRDGFHLLPRRRRLALAHRQAGAGVLGHRGRWARDVRGLGERGRGGESAGRRRRVPRAGGRLEAA